MLHNECSSRECLEKRWHSESIFNTKFADKGWQRVTLPLPAGALSKSTRFRWIAVTSSVPVQWALDDVYIGADGRCPNMCNGQGLCRSAGCKCYKGYSGPSCDVTSMHLIQFVSADFNSGLLDRRIFEEASGCSIGFHCGVVGFGKALVFSWPGDRSLTTYPLNGTNLSFLQFSMVFGRETGNGFCKASSGEERPVLVQYTLDGGTRWDLLYLSRSEDFLVAKVVTVPLPLEAQKVGLQVRWIQPFLRNDSDSDVWAIDDILISSSLFKTATRNSLNFNVGRLQPFCGKDLAIAFTDRDISLKGDIRYVETQSLYVAQGYLMQAELIVGCSPRNFSTASSHDVSDAVIEFEFSLDHGRTWKRVFEASLPESETAIYYPESAFYGNDYRKWHRVTVILPRETWSEGTRFRFVNYEREGTRNISWAIDDVYIGPDCPSQCSGNGKCRNGICICDDAFELERCFHKSALPTGINAKFENSSKVALSGWKIIGGEFNHINQSCGPMTSLSYLNFYKPGRRILLSPPLDLRKGGQIQFFLKISGGSCGTPSSRNKGVFLQFSANGGVVWRHIQEFHFGSFLESSYVHLSISEDMKKRYVVLRWWQPVNQGEFHDQWSIDDVIIGSLPLISSNRNLIITRAIDYDIKNPFDRETDMIIASTESENSKRFCSIRKNSFVFNKPGSERFGMTNDFALTENDVIQFEINIGCSNNFTFLHPVRLQYSHDSGYTWRNMSRCHHLRASSSSQYTSGSNEVLECTSFFSGDYGSWKRVVISILPEVASRRVRFRWIQQVESTNDSPSNWALDNIYIGPSCFKLCSGHGICRMGEDQPICDCDDGYMGDEIGSCSPLETISAREELIEKGLWKQIYGTTTKPSSNTSCFDGIGTRLTETKSIDTSQLRLLRFRLHFAGIEVAGENLLLQFSLDGGINWWMLKAIPPSSTNDWRLFMVNLPLKAKSTSTSFRWWQPLQSQDIVRPNWCISDVIVGRSDILENKIFENFSMKNISAKTWYKVNGGKIGAFDEVGENSTKNALSGQQVIFFEKSQGNPLFLESWDIVIVPGSYAQFDLFMDFKSDGHDDGEIVLEYSNDLGATWQVVIPMCTPDINTTCEYGMGSIFKQILDGSKRRHTVMLPDNLRFKRTRFRWIQHFNNGSRWGLDNIYVGNDCEWACGGFGRCRPFGNTFVCSCDRGFEGSSFCQASAAISPLITYDFDKPWYRRDYDLLEGGEAGNQTGVLLSEKNLRFFRRGIRILQTPLVNTTYGRFIQFYISFDKIEEKNLSYYVIVQSSINNGITWKTLRLIKYFDGRKIYFIQMKLPAKYRQPAVVFRIWQSNLYQEENESVWSIEDLAVGGGQLNFCAPYRDNFDREFGEMWLFKHGARISSYCDHDFPQVERNSVALFQSSNGERSIITKDLRVFSNDYIIQFKISIGCRHVIPSSKGSVRLEFSTDDGVTWSLVKPHCIGSGLTNRECSEDQDQASIYYPGSWLGWLQVTIPLQRKVHTCDDGLVRFRWIQVDWYDQSIIWAIDNVYIGPRCDGDCNGHGICVNGRCTCDRTHRGESCHLSLTSLPDYFNESFDQELLLKSAAWAQVSGGEIVRSDCNNFTFLRNAFVFTYSGDRILMTQDINTTQSSFVQFYLKKEETSRRTDLIATSSEDIHDSLILLQFSINGGVSWWTMKQLGEYLRNQVLFVFVSLSEESRCGSTRFRWWQPSSSGEYSFDWSIDHIIVGKNFKEIDEDFNPSIPGTWTELVSSSVVKSQENCCSTFGPCISLTLGGPLGGTDGCGSCWASTTGVSIGPGSYIHFYAKAGCEFSAFGCHEMILEYSIDHGSSWHAVKSPCLQFGSQCNHYDGGSIFISDQFRTGQRVVVVFPETTWSPSTRFRWRVPNPIISNIWSIDDVYIGNKCPLSCNGHGWCHSGICQCDDGWGGYSCRQPSQELSTSLKDDFEKIQEGFYSNMVGAEANNQCGIVGYGKALHFYKDCSRMLITHDLDTRRSAFLQFQFRFACKAQFTRDHKVMVHYSRNGGMSWMPLDTLHHDGTNHTRFINIHLPKTAQFLGVRFRWWQPHHYGTGFDDWAIDNLIIDGPYRKTLSDSFVDIQSSEFQSGDIQLQDIQSEDIQSGYIQTGYIQSEDIQLQDIQSEDIQSGYIQSEDIQSGYIQSGDNQFVDSLYLDRNKANMWMFYGNTKPSNFCSRRDVICGGFIKNQDVSVSTKDFILEDNSIIQYTIVVSCLNYYLPHQPVHLQYSENYGISWKYLVPQCTPFNKKCIGRESTLPTVHFMSSRWRRRTIKLPERLVERPVRFRWVQFESDVEWALDHVYIGPKCRRGCSGHGDCVQINSNRSECTCDSGISGDFCDQGPKPQLFVKETFNRNDSTSAWDVIDGGKPSMDCGILIDGMSLKFDGIGPRVVESILLDLRDARFVQYRAMIGSNMTSCLPARSRDDGIILQYSIDQKISWITLRELDYSAYSTPVHDYVELPPDARTNSTAIRWWQPFEIDNTSGLVLMGEERAGWALDNILIGGHQINVPFIVETFDRNLSTEDNGRYPEKFDEQFDFYPNGVVSFDFCFETEKSRVIAWPTEGDYSIEKSLTTRQILISNGFMIQFMIKIGCSTINIECLIDFAVRLEYRISPLSQWSLVMHDCWSNSSSLIYCNQFGHHPISIYKANGKWTRVTLPLNFIQSETTQFRWIESGKALSQHAWALDDIYIGESCPNYCSGHGMCTIGSICTCDPGYSGRDCSSPLEANLIQRFKEDFETPLSIATRQDNASASQARHKWSSLRGGEVGFGGCGSLGPIGFGRNVFFNSCGQRSLQTSEMDLRRASIVQYVIQIGMKPPRSSCNVDISREVGILLEFSTNSGVTWQTLMEHRSLFFNFPRRIPVKLPNEARTSHTILRWWQPVHGGIGADQWALDNIEIISSPFNRFMNRLHIPAQSRKGSLIKDDDAF